MIKNKRWGATVVLLFGVSLAYCQDFSDVLRYSQMFPQTDARSMAIGNAIGAVGADFSCLNINPAGIGLYRSNEFEFTLNLNQDGTNTNYLNTPENGTSMYNFNIGSMSLVFGKVRHDPRTGKPVKKGWVSLNYALGFSRTNNFTSDVYLQGINTHNSILQSWAQQANANGVGNPTTSQALASQAGLIGNASGSYTAASDSERKNLQQTDDQTTHGAMNQINFGVGANYSNQWYIGGSVLVSILNYHYYRDFTEYNLNQNPVAYVSSEYTDSFSTSGIGVSANFGVIYRPNDLLRFGLSAQLPTFYTMNDNYSSTVTGTTVSGGELGSTPYSGSESYQIITPWRATASAAVFFEKNGLISLDCDFVDYTSSQITFSNDPGYSRLQNAQIAANLTQAVNARVGTEWRAGPMYFRGGFGYYGSPYQADAVPANANGSYDVYSLGLGYRDNKYAMDLTYQYMQTAYYYQPYTLDPTLPPSASGASGTNVKDVRNSFIFTFTERF